MTSTTWSPAGFDGHHTYGATALAVFWPEGQFHAALTRWPHLVDSLGATWDEHRVLVEQYCAAIERDGLAVNQVAADVDEFGDHLARRGIRRPAERDLLEYPELGEATVRLVAWPPDRTAPCWCGSTRKYKQCCRKHGLGALP